MHIRHIGIGDHVALVGTSEPAIDAWVGEQFLTLQPESLRGRTPDLFISLRPGYGAPLREYDVDIRKANGVVTYRRDDFLLETDENCSRSTLHIHDELALKHGLMTLYSAFIVHRGWGLLIHSSCIVNGGRAYLFAGQSGAGKSTVARLSRPRTVLSDEATLVRIAPEGAIAYDSPFRSDSLPEFGAPSRPLAGIHLLEQSPDIERHPLSAAETALRLMDKIFYWAYDPEETKKVFGLCRLLAAQVTGYRLKFQKNDLFWERIS